MQRDSAGVGAAIACTCGGGWEDGRVVISMAALSDGWTISTIISALFAHAGLCLPIDFAWQQSTSPP